jgi:hypothetical protein
MVLVRRLLFAGLALSLALFGVSVHAPGFSHTVVGARGGHVTAVEPHLAAHGHDYKAGGLNEDSGDANSEPNGLDAGVHFHACPHFAPLQVDWRLCRIEVVTAAAWPETTFMIASSGSGPPSRPPQTIL